MLLKIDFSPRAKQLREMTKKLHAEKGEELTQIQKVFYLLQKQNRELQMVSGVE